MKGLQESPLFEGRPGRLLLTYDLAALERRMYYKAGVLIGWSLAHGGPGPRCLHPVLFQVGSTCFYPSVADSPNRFELLLFPCFIATVDVQPESVFRGFQLERHHQS